MNGILLLDKPEEWTSFDCVAKLRGILRERRIGHSGTLDPLATGLLVIFVGRATRAVAYEQEGEKEYIAGLRPCIVTDTQDITGNVLTRCDHVITQDELLYALKDFIGEIEQIPPMYSAVKINGQRLYTLARKGKQIERTPRRITIKSIELLGMDGEDYKLKIRCSRGTYIRTLCHDIGAVLGCGAVMSSLRRTVSGRFSVREAMTLGDVEKVEKNGLMQERLLPVDSLFMDYDKIIVHGQNEKKCLNGSDFRVLVPDGIYRIYGSGGEFLALARANSGMAGVIKSFFEV